MPCPIQSLMPSMQSSKRSRTFLVALGHAGSAPNRPGSAAAAWRPRRCTGAELLRRRRLSTNLRPLWPQGNPASAVLLQLAVAVDELEVVAEQGDAPAVVHPPQLVVVAADEGSRVVAGGM